MSGNELTDINELLEKHYKNKEEIEDTIIKLKKEHNSLEKEINRLVKKGEMLSYNVIKNI